VEDTSTDTKISEMLEALADGKWHTKEELLEKTKLKREDVEKVLKFLEDYKFIMANEDDDGKVKLNEAFRKLLIREANP
jgi:transcription initiation factor IIE alpha subunit